MSRGREVLVGVVIVLSVAVAAVGTLWLQDFGWGRPENEVEAQFAEVGQLSEGNEVRFRGVSVGRVRSIHVDPSGLAVRVTMNVQSDLALPDSAGVLLAPESMFGEWQAEIVDRAQYPQFEFSRNMSEGVLPGYALPDMSRLTATADQIADNLNSLTTRVEMAFSEETAQNIADAIENIQNVSEDLTRLIRQQATTFDRLAGRMESSADDLGAAARSAGSAFDRVDGILARGQVDSLLVDSRAAARNIRELASNLETTSRELDGTLRRADSTFARMDRITQQIESGEGTLGRLLTDTTLALRAEGALTELQTLLEDFRTNPKRYVRLSIF